jgi:hypothetical protein
MGLTSGYGSGQMRRFIIGLQIFRFAVGWTSVVQTLKRATPSGSTRSRTILHPARSRPGIPNPMPAALIASRSAPLGRCRPEHGDLLAQSAQPPTDRRSDAGAPPTAAGRALPPEVGRSGAVRLARSHGSRPVAWIDPHIPPARVLLAQRPAQGVQRMANGHSMSVGAGAHNQGNRI